MMHMKNVAEKKKGRKMIMDNIIVHQEEESEEKKLIAIVPVPKALVLGSYPVCSTESKKNIISTDQTCSVHIIWDSSETKMITFCMTITYK